MIKSILTRAFAAGVALVAACASASAFTCPAKVSKPLIPLNRTVKLKGVAEISDCFGNSFIYIKVSGVVPNGTAYFPVFRSLNPLIGPIISMKFQTGEIIWEGVTAYGVVNGGLTGRVMSITDQSFNDLMTVTW